MLRAPVVWACCGVYFLLPTVLKQLSSFGIEAVGWLAVIPFALAGVAMLLNSRAADRLAPLEVLVRGARAVLGRRADDQPPAEVSVQSNPWA